MKIKFDTTFAFVLFWALEVAATTEQNGTLTVYKEPETGDPGGVSLHSRRKRYIVFPKGSSLQLILELLVHVPTQFEVVIGPTLQVAWPLPSDPSDGLRSKRSSPGSQNFFLKFSNRFSALVSNKAVIFRDLAALMDSFGMTVGLAWQLPDDPTIYSEFKKKHKIYKRNVFKKMEAFISKPGGANGRQCVLKALCESGQRTPSKKPFLTEILHKIFSVDAEEEDLEENHEDKLYRKAHQSENQNCETLYPDCHFSVFDSVK